LADVQQKARAIAGDRVPSTFQFSERWLYGFLKFFRISCRIAADSASSDRHDLPELQVRDHLSRLIFAHFYVCVVAENSLFLCGEDPERFCIARTLAELSALGHLC